MRKEFNELQSGEDVHPVRAKWFIPCLIGECPGQMQLHLRRRDGAFLQRPYNDGPYYTCMREGCHYHTHPRGLHEIHHDYWIRDAKIPRKEKNDGDPLTEKDMETMI